MFGRKEHLVPFEKADRRIKLEKWGKQERISIAGILLCVLGAVCMLYCVGIAIFGGYGSYFFLIWGVMAAFFGLWGAMLLQRKIWKKIPRWIRYAFVTCFVIGVFIFGWVEALIIGSWLDTPAPGADYCIVLGAQWKQSGPSYVLKKRLDAAVTYLQANPETRVIVSGGQGYNEPISEAEGMADYLERCGIAAERILREDQSRNTYENLRLSANLLNPETDRVVIVTNNFHLFRGKAIAKKMGYKQVDGLAAASHPWFLPNNLLREFFGVVKDFLLCQL